MVPRGLEPRTLRLLAVRSNQPSYETSVQMQHDAITNHTKSTSHAHGLVQTPPGSFLGRSWSCLGTSWGRPGTILGRYRAIFGPLGNVDMCVSVKSWHVNVDVEVSSQ